MSFPLFITWKNVKCFSHIFFLKLLKGDFLQIIFSIVLLALKMSSLLRILNFYVIPRLIGKKTNFVCIFNHGFIGLQMLKFVFKKTEFIFCFILNQSVDLHFNWSKHRCYTRYVWESRQVSYKSQNSLLLILKIFVFS